MEIRVKHCFVGWNSCRSLIASFVYSDKIVIEIASATRIARSLKGSKAV